MKNKIFLTSMFAVMLALPAHANTFYDPTGSSQVSGEIRWDSTNGYNTNDTNCAADPLIYRDQTAAYGTYTLTADWLADQCPIILNPNNGSAANQGGASSNTPKTLYAKYNFGAYKVSSDNTADGTLSSLLTLANAASPNGLDNTPPTPKIGLPVGITPAVTFSVTAPTDPDTNSPYSVTNPGNRTMQRSFAGYYASNNTSNTDMMTWLLSETNTQHHQYIDEDGYITTYGDTVAKGISKINNSCPTTTWYAQYDCPQLTGGTFPTVSLTGYTLGNWVNENDSSDIHAPGSSTTGVYICNDTDFVATFTPDHYTVIYNSGSCTTTSTNLHTDTNVAVYDSNYTVPSAANNAATSMTIKTGYHLVVDSNTNDPLWNTTSGQTTGNFPGASETPWKRTSGLTVYAVCEPNTYSVIYDCTVHNTATNATYVSPVSPAWDDASNHADYVTYNSSYSLRSPSSVCSRGGWNIGNGWSCHKQGDDSTTYSAGDLMPAYNVVCEPSYGQLSITYDCGSINGSVSGSVTGSPDSVYTGQSNYTLKPASDATGTGACNSAQIAGYHLVGWDCNYNLETGSSTANPLTHYDAAQVLQSNIGLTTNATCYARWAANSVTLKWYEDDDAQANDTPSTTNTCQYGFSGASITVPSAPSKTGYTFNGWKVKNYSSN